MKRIKLKFTYEADMWMADREYEDIKEQADLGELEKELKGALDNVLIEDRSKESSKIKEFYFGVDKEWQ
ncbi:hypothetical protein [Peptoniphilus hominis (ex Hitch et al. 2025)]|uniref:DUF1902 domain-containing protein n=1 Tax=Peptoniphilus hominis (ex Hitch et al. 2025) TaxID=3133174 RepID=A0ABV1CBG2_9FIRM